MKNLGKVSFSALVVVVMGGLLASCNQTPAALRGCEASYQVPDTAALSADLTSARSKWAAAKIQNYTYTLNYGLSGLVSGQKTVVVRGGQVASSTEGEGASMEKLFDDIQKQIAAAAQADSCNTVKASYDPNDGHVLSSSSANLKKGLQDAFGGYTITAFQKD